MVVARAVTVRRTRVRFPPAPRALCFTGERCWSCPMPRGNEPGSRAPTSPRPPLECPADVAGSRARDSLGDCHPALRCGDGRSRRPREIGQGATPSRARARRRTATSDGLADESARIASHSRHGDASVHLASCHSTLQPSAGSPYRSSIRVVWQRRTRSAPSPTGADMRDTEGAYSTARNPAHTQSTSA